MRLIYFSAIVFIFTACHSSKKTTQPLAELKLTDVAYGSFESSKMDVYLPAGRTAETPFVINIHGGGWVSVDKKSDRPFQEYLLKKGIASININYRFISKNVHYQALMADIDSAVQYCINNAQAWNTRSDEFITCGPSAGGHLALLYAYTTNKNISRIVAMVPPTNFTDTAVINAPKNKGSVTLLEWLSGDAYVVNQPLPQSFFDVSPVTKVKNIPVLVIHGTKDNVVPYQQSLDLVNQLKSKNIRYKHITLPDADHDMKMGDSSTREMIFREIGDWVLDK